VSHSLSSQRCPQGHP